MLVQQHPTETMTPRRILQAYFGLQKEKPTPIAEFVEEVRNLRETDPDGYREVVDLAAAELAVEPNYS